MKLLLLTLVLVVLTSSCSTPKYLMQNCKAIGSDLYECEHVRQKTKAELAK